MQNYTDKVDEEDKMVVVEIPASAFRMLPAAPGACPVCYTPHDPKLPHNRESLSYQFAFGIQNGGKSPTWADAMQHCDPKMRELWTAELVKRGIDVGQVTVPAPAQENPS